MKTKILIDELINNKSFHASHNYFYKSKKKEFLNILSKSNFNKGKSGIENFEPFGILNFPYFEMGAINTMHLFNLDEFIVFSYYWSKRKKYKNVADLGANIGLHSIILEKCGFNVNSYEPDPLHIKKMHKMLIANHSKNILVNQKAVSVKDGVMNFVRVVENTTSSHLEGAKESAYGKLDTFKVETISIKNIFNENDFIKMDIEGEEANVITCLSKDDWENTDMIMEVGSAKNANIIFNHLRKINVNMFSQKNGWSLVKSQLEIPNTYREGALFITTQNEMNWR